MRHIEEVSKHAEDDYLPLLVFLMSSCISYPATRVVKCDNKYQVSLCSNPFSAIIIGSHSSRWEKQFISNREYDGLLEDRALTKFVGCGFQTVVFIRIVALLLLQRVSSEMEKISQKPKANVVLSEDEEIQLVLRRRKISRLWEIEESLTKVIGLQIFPELSKASQIAQFREFCLLMHINF